MFQRSSSTSLRKKERSEDVVGDSGGCDDKDVMCAGIRGISEGKGASVLMNSAN